MTPARTPGGAWIAAETGLIARASGEGLVVEDWGADVQAVLTGIVATDLPAACAGEQTGPARARLRALARVADGTARTALEAAAAGCFRPASVADVLRRDGWNLLWLELTAQCNERCVHCYAESSPERTEALPRETVLALLDEAAAMGFPAVQFTGGDPLLCPFLAEAAARARSLGLAVEVYTNGLALGPTLLEKLRALDAAFAFSVYGALPATHDAVTRVPGSHARTADAIRRAVASGAPVRVGVIVTAENAAEAAAAVAFAEGLGVPASRVGVDVTHAVGRGTYDPTLVAPPSGAGGMHTGLGDALPAPDGGAPAGGPATPRRRGRLAVGPDGTLYPCIFSRWLALGRVGPGRGLAAVLDAARPAAGWCTSGSEDTARNDRLQCGECRVAGAALAALATTAGSA